MDHSFVDIHCHILPGIDDGAKDWIDALAMARVAVEDGTATIVATPHQLGSYGQNHGDEIQLLAAELNDQLKQANVPLTVLPGAEIRIEPDLVERIATGDVLTLGDHHRHVLVELPHELYFPLDALIRDLKAHRITAILAHPERNQGILREPSLLDELVDAGCLMQITAGSLCGMMGPNAQQMSEWMVAEGLVHIVATDAHSPRSRRPLLGRAFERLCELADEPTAEDLCCRYPARVAAGRTIATGRRGTPRRRPKRTGWWDRRASA